MEYTRKWTASESDLRSARLHEAGMTGEEDSFCRTTTTFDEYILVCVSKGSGRYHSGNKKYRVSEGGAFLVYPGTEVSWESSESNPWSCEWIAFSGDEIPYIVSQTMFTVHMPIIRKSKREKEAADKIRCLIEAENKHSTLVQHLSNIGALYEILSLFVWSEESAACTGGSYYVVYKGTQYIDYNYSSGIEAKDVAHAIGVHPSYLVYSFQEVLGKTAKDYLDDLCLGKACTMLGESDMPVEDVAKAVGYRNTNSFSMVFQDRYGMTPREYRRLCIRTAGM
jgi:AraC-like DNA-binding protein